MVVPAKVQCIHTYTYTVDFLNDWKLAASVINLVV